MAIATRHRTENAPAARPVPSLTIRREGDTSLVASVMNKPEAEIRGRFAAGHRVYFAWRSGQPAAWGWVATHTAEIGELRSTFSVPAGERYLWNFVTLPEHRGQGIYPRLLDEIVRRESAEAERFWIAYAPENHASATGIHRAGFTTVADLSFDALGRPAVRDRVLGAGAAAARLLGLPTAEEPLSPCWRCVRQGRDAARSCTAGSCCCDYQRAESGCAARPALKTTGRTAQVGPTVGGRRSSINHHPETIDQRRRS